MLREHKAWWEKGFACGMSILKNGGGKKGFSKFSKQSLEKSLAVNALIITFPAALMLHGLLFVLLSPFV
jgi:hypothetical protein